MRRWRHAPANRKAKRTMSEKDHPTLMDWLHIQSPSYSENKTLGRVIGLAVISLGSLMALIGLGVILSLIMAVFLPSTYAEMTAIENAKSTDTATTVRNLGLAAAAVIGLPFLVWRSLVAQKQADVSEQGLITDRINKAVEGLGADKVVKRQRVNSHGKKVYAKTEDGTPDLTRPIWDEVTEPNLEVRIGAIFSLERISQDSPRDHIQIMEILCAYIVQNSDRSDVEMPEDEGELSFHEWQSWASKFRQKPRPDIDVALRVLSRRKEHLRKLESASGYRLDLQGVDLRCLSILKLDLSEAELATAKLQGAFLPNAKLQGSRLHFTRLEGAVLSGAKLEKAQMTLTNLNGANLMEVNCQRVDLTGANLSNALLFGTSLQCSRLFGAEFKDSGLSNVGLQGAYFGELEVLENTNLSDAKFRGAFFQSIDLSGTRINQRQVNETFGDRDVTLSEDLVRPLHWRPEDSEIELLEDVDDQWRAWQKSIGFDPEDPSTWDAPSPKTDQY